MDAPFTHRVADLELEPAPLDPSAIVEGSPDVEADELFVVVSGRATVEVEGGPTLELEPGVVGVLRAGDRAVWRIHQTLRKVFQITDVGPPG